MAHPVVEQQLGQEAHTARAMANGTEFQVSPPARLGGGEQSPLAFFDFEDDHGVPRAAALVALGAFLGIVLLHIAGFRFVVGGQVGLGR